MNTERQKRHSCELCRSRKLKCSGEKTGCSRCAALSLTCKFRDKGSPGRPRKRFMAIPSPPQAEDDIWERQGRPRPVHRQLLHQQEQVRQTQQQRSYSFSSLQTRPDPCGLLEFSSPLFNDFSTSRDIDLLLTEINPSTLHNELASHDEYFGTVTTHDSSIGSDFVPETVSSPATLSCECANDVFKTLRSLQQGPLSHTLLQRLRFGGDLFERLITCPVCYNLAKPPRITIQNVLLIGRLMVEVTSGYQRYLQWIRDTTSDQGETIYLAPGEESSSLLSFKLSSNQFREIAINGLRDDIQRISTLGEQFGRRQQHRHSIGHEECPNSQGRCCKEDHGVEIDPLDICPRNPAAKTLTPCFRIVEEVQRLTRKVQDDIG